MDQQAALVESAGFEPQVTVEGRDTVTVTPTTIQDLEVATKPFEIICATGNRYTADWTGPTVASLLDAAGTDPETTHVVVESADEYQVVIPAREALGGLLAFLKDGESIGNAQEYMNRLVCPGTEGARDIKGAARIEPVTLEPGEDPEALENLFPDGERFTAEREMDDPESDWEPNPPSP